MGSGRGKGLAVGAVKDTTAPSSANPRYDASFYDGLRAGSRQSAAAVVPLLLKYFAPRSVVDVGCGSGEWLSIFRELGLTDLLGIDGAWAQHNVSAAPFREHDLAQPLHLDRCFDLAICLEVAEHVDPANARTLVEGLARLAPVVVFSAAVPFQGGDGHVNEQWPSYWTDLFDAQDYLSFFSLRHSLWNRDDIELWYRQNIIFFCARNRPALLEQFVKFERETSAPHDVVHPELHLRTARDLVRSQRYAERLEQRVRDSDAEIRRLKTELERIKNFGPLRLYRSLRRALAGTKTTRIQSQVAQERGTGPSDDESR
jgi:SAM-dependent methyltransferase